MSDGFKERQVAYIERTMGFHIARLIHIYLYAANHLWDTDRISRLRRSPNAPLVREMRKDKETFTSAIRQRWAETA